MSVLGSKSASWHKALLAGLLTACCAVPGRAVDWKKFTSVKGDFAVMLPGTPTEQTSTSNIKDDTHAFDLNRGKADYSVIYIDFDQSVSWMEPDQVLDGFVTGGIKENKKNKVLSERHLTLGGHPGREIKYQTPEGNVAKARIFLVKQRLYQVTAVAGAKDITAPDTDNFLGSLIFLGKYQPPTPKLEWKTFAPEKAGFTALMPGTPGGEKDPAVPTAYGPVEGYSYMAMAPTGMFGVSYSDYPASIAQVETKTVLEGERDRILKGSPLKLVSERDVTLGDKAGKEIELVAPDGTISRSRLFLAKQRLYQVMVVVPKAKADTPDAKQDAAKFLDSFQLLPAP